MWIQRSRIYTLEVDGSLLMQTGNQRLSKTVNSFVIGRKAKYFPIVNRSVYRPGFGSNLLPSGLTGGLKSPPEDF